MFLFTNSSLKNNSLTISKITFFAIGIASLLIIENYNAQDSNEDISPSFLSDFVEGTLDYPLSTNEEEFEVNIGIPFQV